MTGVRRGVAYQKEESNDTPRTCHGGYSHLVCTHIRAHCSPLARMACHVAEMKHSLTRCWAPVLRARLDAHGSPGISRGYISKTSNKLMLARLRGRIKMPRPNSRPLASRLSSHQSPPCMLAAMCEMRVSCPAWPCPPTLPRGGYQQGAGSYDLTGSGRLDGTAPAGIEIFLLRLRLTRELGCWRRVCCRIKPASMECSIGMQVGCHYRGGSVCPSITSFPTHSMIRDAIVVVFSRYVASNNQEIGMPVYHIFSPTPFTIRGCHSPSLYSVVEIQLPLSSSAVVRYARLSHPASHSS